MREELIDAIRMHVRRGSTLPNDIGDDLDLVRSGYIDSLGFLELIGTLESRFGTTVDFSEVDVGRIATIKALNAAFSTKAGDRSPGVPISVKRADLATVLSELGLDQGDGVMVHSSLHHIGKAEEGASTYLGALRLVVGDKGTIVVPSFTFAFARGERFDPASSAGESMGVFADHVRELPFARRSPHPLQSVAAIGPFADDICSRDTAGAFDPGSPFDRMLELDFKLLLLGASVDNVSMIHYSEQHVGVPYRFWKDFAGEVKTPSGWQPRSYRLYARDQERKPEFDLSVIEAHLRSAGVWRETPVGSGRVALTGLRAFHESASEILRQDPWRIVKNRAALVAS